MTKGCVGRDDKGSEGREGEEKVDATSCCNSGERLAGEDGQGG